MQMYSLFPRLFLMYVVKRKRKDYCMVETVCIMLYKEKI